MNRVEHTAETLLPVDITIWKKGSTPPTDGVVVKKGDTLTISLSGTSTPSQPIAPGQPVWYWQQLKSDGTYTGWQPMGASCIGNQFDYTATASGIFQVEAVFFGDTNNALQYVRKQDDPFGRHNPTWQVVPSLKKGTPDSFGVVDAQIQINIRNSAKDNLGSTAYAQDVANPPFKAFDDKCNLFVARAAGSAGAAVPWFNGIITPYPPTANQWAGIEECPPGTGYENEMNTRIDGWSLLISATFNPQPGFVYAEPSPGSHGHSGIVDFDGQIISAGQVWVNRLQSISSGDQFRCYYTGQ